MPNNSLAGFGRNGFNYDRSYRASGVRYWGTAYNRLMWNRTFPEMSAEAVTEALRGNNRKRDDLVASVRRAAATTPPNYRVGGDAPRMSTRPNRSGVYVGDVSPTRVKGKGRSVALKDIYKESLALQPFDPPERRIGSLHVGAQGRKGQSWATMMSNFGANKELGEGWAGASAGRVRGMRNLLAHPETFMGRFLWVYAAKHVTDAITNWRGWNKVSWGMTDNQAEAAMRKEREGRPEVARFGVGALAGAGTQFASMLTDTWLSYFTVVPSPVGFVFGKDGRLTEAQAARASKWVEGLTGWMRGGFKGKVILSDDEVAAEASADADGQRREAISKAKKQYNEMVTKNLVRQKDVIAKRGVGGIEDIRASLNKHDDFKSALAEMTGAELLKIDYDLIVDKVINRMMTGKKDK